MNFFKKIQYEHQVGMNFSEKDWIPVSAGMNLFEKI